MKILTLFFMSFFLLAACFITSPTNAGTADDGNGGSVVIFETDSPQLIQPAPCDITSQSTGAIGNICHSIGKSISEETVLLKSTESLISRPNGDNLFINASSAGGMANWRSSVSGSAQLISYTSPYDYEGGVFLWFHAPAWNSPLALSYGENLCASVQSVSSVFQSSSDTNHLLIVLDPAHGYDVAGKRSPETNKRNGDIDTSLLFYEYQFSRKIINNLEPLLDSVGIYHIRSNPYDYEIGLRARVNNTNAYAKLWRKSPQKLFPDSADSENFQTIKNSSQSSRKTFFLSLHNNASGNGVNWMKARGFSAWTSRHVSRSDLAADIILDEFEAEFPDIKIIGHRESNFAVLMCKPYAVLVECLFQDTKLDVLLLNDPDFQIRYTYVLLRSILKISTTL